MSKHITKCPRCKSGELCGLSIGYKCLKCGNEPYVPTDKETYYG